MRLTYWFGKEDEEEPFDLEIDDNDVLALAKEHLNALDKDELIDFILDNTKITDLYDCLEEELMDEYEHLARELWREKNE